MYVRTLITAGSGQQDPKSVKKWGTKKTAKIRTDK